LDDEKQQIENDLALKKAAAKLKAKFVTEAQALVHGDLHSGSVMCSPAETFVIDSEFAFYGPMGFDTGAFLGNLLLAYVSQAGHHSNDEHYGEWILASIVTFWNTFQTNFLKLWDDPSTHTGFCYGRQTFHTPNEVAFCQADFLATVLADTLGFAGMKMVRRLVGISHVEDLDSIENVNVRANCERHGLGIAKILIKTASSIQSIEDAVQIARDQKVIK
jgi:5-methylthioribose kinase